MTWHLRTLRSNLRLVSALVMLAFVICHLTAHCLLLVSLEAAEATRKALMYPWRTWIGTVLLSTAFFVHLSNALWSVYIRRSLRLARWEWAQLALGLCIPALLIPHVVSTGIAENLLNADITFDKFHAVKIINDAVEQVRRAEQKTQSLLRAQVRSDQVGVVDREDL